MMMVMTIPLVGDEDYDDGDDDTPTGSGTRTMMIVMTIPLVGDEDYDDSDDDTTSRGRGL